MLVLLLRTLMIYLLIVAAMRLMGKRQLGELQPSELVSTILISNLASISIESPEVPLAASLAPVCLIVVLELVASALCYKSPRAAKILSGSPVAVIRSGKIDQSALRELRFSASDLLEALRGKDVFDPGEVDYALIETNGSLSVCKTPGSDTPTRDDMNIPPPKAKTPLVPLVIDGQPLADNLAWCGKDKAWLERTLKKQRCPLSQVLVLLGDDAGAIELIKKENR
ncbi:MAG TPA: DUF421 domain-containing protein [Candidatus Fournierella merdigallinarum]|nr:DUF421 domain-containing protein [Candidatus Fournierella merdigallinarum]